MRIDLYEYNNDGTTNGRRNWFDNFVETHGLSNAPLGSNRSMFIAALEKYNARFLPINLDAGYEDCIEFDSIDDAVLFLLKWS